MEAGPSYRQHKMYKQNIITYSDCGHIDEKSPITTIIGIFTCENIRLP